MVEAGEPKPKIGKKIEGIEGVEVEVEKVPEKRIEPEVTEEEKAREESRKLREIEEEKKKGRELKKAEEEWRMRIEEIEEKKAKERLEKEKKKIWEAVKEFGGIPEEELKEYDDLGDKPEDWIAREAELKEGHKEVIGTTAGIESERARQFLTKRLGKKEKQKNWKVINAGVMYNDTKWADDIREWLRYDKEGGMVSKIVSKIPKIREWLGVDKEGGSTRGGINAKIVKFLRLNKSEWWYETRKLLDKVLPGGFFIANQDLLHSEIGVSAKSETKRKLLDEFGKDFPADAILSFLGNASPEAKKMVEEYYGIDKKRLKWADQRYLESIYEKSL